jgi:hypothetical protein
MALFRNSPPASGQIGVNHAKDATGRRIRFCGALKVRLSAMPPTSVTLQKIAHLWIGNGSVP